MRSKLLLLATLILALEACKTRGQGGEAEIKRGVLGTYENWKQIVIEGMNESTVDQRLDALSAPLKGNKELRDFFMAPSLKKQTLVSSSLGLSSALLFEGTVVPPSTKAEDNVCWAAIFYRPALPDGQTESFVMGHLHVGNPTTTPLTTSVNIYSMNGLIRSFVPVFDPNTEVIESIRESQTVTFNPSTRMLTDDDSYAIIPVGSVFPISMLKSFNQPGTSRCSGLVLKSISIKLER